MVENMKEAEGIYKIMGTYESGVETRGPDVIQFDCCQSGFEIRHWSTRTTSTILQIQG